MIGAGSWGTTLANLLAEKSQRVTLWVYEEDLFRTLSQTRENAVFLPGVLLPPNIQPTLSLEEACRGKEVVVNALPSHAVRGIFRQACGHLRQDVLVVSATKGMEEGTHHTPSRVLREILGSGSEAQVACLSGPSFAREVSRKMPTAVALAATTPEAAKRAQDLFTRSYFRVYTNPDLTGVELGGAIKNVMAIAAGTSDGLGFGHNSRAALITRSLAEMTRLGLRVGGEAETFSGLAGLGDLVLTCTGDLSRNRQVGIELGKGKKLPEILKEMRMVAEGVKTAKEVWELSREREVEMPITEQVYRILYEGKNPEEAVRELMSRDPRSERDSYTGV